jgi:hypothetical protein
VKPAQVLTEQAGELPSGAGEDRQRIHALPGQVRILIPAPGMCQRYAIGLDRPLEYSSWWSLTHRCWSGHDRLDVRLYVRE